MSVILLGKGFLGQRIFNHLSENKYNVKIFSKSELDYTNFNVLRNFLDSRKHLPLFIINASGYTGVPNIDAAEDEKELCWKLNVEVPAVIASAIEASGVGYLLHISSGCIYNGYEKDFSEKDIPNFGLFNSESSFYAKSKHAAETILLNYPSYMFRIRMPFNEELHQRNYLNKLLNYDKLIDESNSLTCINDFCCFINKFISKFKDYGRLPFGVYNVVNEGTANASEIVGMMRAYGIINPRHSFIELDELQTKAKRSNTVLNTSLIKSLGLELPHIIESMRTSVSNMRDLLNKKKQ